MSGRIGAGYLVDAASAGRVAAALTELAEHRRRNGLPASAVLAEIATGLRDCAEDYVATSAKASADGRTFGIGTEARALSNHDDDADVLDPEAVGVLLGRTSRRVRQLLQDGRLHGEQVGSHWVIRRSDVRAYQRTEGGFVNANRA